MLEQSELEYLVEQNSGVLLHRKRVLMAFSHLHDGPLLDVLFKITRTALRKAKGIAALRGVKQSTSKTFASGATTTESPLTPALVE